MAGIYRKYKPISKEKFDKKGYTREELIESYIPLVLSITKKFPKKYIERDEAIGIGLVELTRCIDQCTINSQAELTSYIRTSVTNRIKEHCFKYYNRSVIRTKGRNDDPVKTSTLPKYLGYYKHYFETDLQDTINSIVSSPIEQIIIQRIIEGGYTLEEIGEELGVSRSWVGIIREQLFERLLCELQK